MRARKLRGRRRSASASADSTLERLRQYRGLKGFWPLFFFQPDSSASRAAPALPWTQTGKGRPGARRYSAGGEGGGEAFRGGADSGAIFLGSPGGPPAPLSLFFVFFWGPPIAHRDSGRRARTEATWVLARTVAGTVLSAATVPGDGTSRTGPSPAQGCAQGHVGGIGERNLSTRMRHGVREFTVAGSAHSSRRTGSVKVNVEPSPTWLFTQIRPPWSSMNFRESASPRPVPSTFLSAVPTCRNSSKTAS